MVKNLTSLGVTPNEIDSDVGENGEEDEDEELRHRDDCKLKLRFTLNLNLLPFDSIVFCLIPLMRSRLQILNCNIETHMLSYC